MKKPKSENKHVAKKKGFHGFATPKEALDYYYKHELDDRHPEGYEYGCEKRLLEWLATRG